MPFLQLFGILYHYAIISTTGDSARFRGQHFVNPCMKSYIFQIFVAKASISNKNLAINAFATLPLSNVYSLIIPGHTVLPFAFFKNITI